MRCRLTTKEAAKYFVTRLGSNVSRIPALVKGTEEYMGMADQFLFGSAYPFYPIKEYVDEFFSKFAWKKEVLDRILYKNALKALKLENDPVFREMYELDKVTEQPAVGSHGKSLLWHQPVDKDGLGVA